MSDNAQDPRENLDVLVLNWKDGEWLHKNDVLLLLRRLAPTSTAGREWSEVTRILSNRYHVGDIELALDLLGKRHYHDAAEKCEGPKLCSFEAAESGLRILLKALPATPEAGSPAAGESQGAG